MKSNWIKTLTKIAVKSKDTIVRYAPQIMAGCGAACFVAATVCAVKETPDAMEKLKEKEALDPEMTVLQKAAVIVPEYKKTLIFTGAGGALTLAAWKIEATRFAEMAACLAAAMKDNDRLVAAAKEVVGEEKTAEIQAKKEELLAQDYCTEDGKCIPSDQIPYLFKFPGGVKFWSTWAKFKAGMEYNIRTLAVNKNISLYEVLVELGADESDLTKDMYNETWNIENLAIDEVLSTDELIDGAYELLDYEAKPYNHGRGDNYIAAWEIEWHTPPMKQKKSAY